MAGLRKHEMIPARWLNCPRKGAVINKTFVPMKTPLDTRYDSQIPEDCRFDLPMLFDSMKKSQVQLGLIIDLTNTTRFYNVEELKQYGCAHVKLACRGHAETPTDEQTKHFINVCEVFIRKHQNQAIGVHCTHGFNRTGFLIVSYLIETLDWSLGAAIKEFSSARSPGIYKQDYLDELVKRYDELPLHAPDLPDWSLDCDDSGREVDRQHMNNSGDQPTGRKRAELFKKNALFMDGVVEGVEQVTQQPKLAQIQGQVQEMCGWEKSGFPGAQPVSLGVSNLELLKGKPYKVSWKADGVRFLMLIDGPGETYMLDRDNTVFHVPALSFWRKKNLNECLRKTLVDGEMIIDIVQGKPTPRFLVYDVIRFEGLETGKTCFTTRLRCIREDIIQPRHEKMKLGQLNKTREPFSVRVKEFFDLEKASSILDGRFSKEVSHGVDGLIFQPEPDPYCPGRCTAMLKWKPPSMSTVDFRLKIVLQESPGMLREKICLLYVGGCEQHFGVMKYTKEVKDLESKIVECYLDAKTGLWVFMRQRTDKSYPNSYDTASNVLDTIRRPLLKDHLFEYIKEEAYKLRRPTHTSASNSDIMPPPSKVPRK